VVPHRAGDGRCERAHRRSRRRWRALAASTLVRSSEARQGTPSATEPRPVWWSWSSANGHREGDPTPREHCQRSGSGRSTSTCFDPCRALTAAPTTDPCSGSRGHLVLPRQGHSRELLNPWKAEATQGEQAKLREEGGVGVVEEEERRHPTVEELLTG
jgi:hypothetical protein